MAQHPNAAPQPVDAPTLLTPHRVREHLCSTHRVLPCSSLLFGRTDQDHTALSVAEYRDKFTELSRYATEEVAEDKNKQELFLDGLASSLQYQFMSYPFPTFQ
jgi:hypothetical protein